MKNDKIKRLLQVRVECSVFMILLVLSGLTAFPVRTGAEILRELSAHLSPAWSAWILAVVADIDKTPEVIFYATDWLAFAHIIIASFFIPVLINPVRNRHNVICGMAACILVFPLAFIFGPIRGIPFMHQLVDCSFGVFGFLLLGRISHHINQLEKQHAINA